MVDAPPPPSGGLRRPARMSTGRAVAAAAAASPGGSSRWRVPPLSFGTALGDGGLAPLPPPSQDDRAVSPPPKAPRSPEEIPLGLPIRPRRNPALGRPAQAEGAKPGAHRGTFAATPLTGQQVVGALAPVQNTSAAPGLARVLYDFEPSDAVRRDFSGDAVMALRAGQLVELERSEYGEEWWRGSVHGTTFVGAFPSSFVEPLVE